MFVLMVYDVNVDRVNKVLKTGRKYLNHIQNSVLEGELSNAQFKSLKHEIKNIIKEDQDSVRFYLLRTTHYLKVEEMGLPPAQAPRETSCKSTRSTATNPTPRRASHPHR